MAVRSPTEAAAAGGVLPCLQSNNSTEPGPEGQDGRAKSGSVASKQYVKSAVALSWNVKALADRYGIARLGFLTLTFADHVTDPREAQKRFNSLATHVLRHRYEDYIRVFERQKSGRIHYHLLVVLKDDIRTGVDFDELSRGVYRSVPKGSALRAEWDFWRENAEAYRFGRTELLPIKSSDVAIARYVGKYIGKHLTVREDRDKGTRLVEYSRGARVASTRYQFHTAGSAYWRLKLEVFVGIVAEQHGLKKISLAELSALLGPRWAYSNRAFIMQLPVEIPPERQAWFDERIGQGRPKEALDGL